MMKKMNRNTFNVLFLSVVFAATMYSVFHNEDISSIFSYIKEADNRYWLLGVIFVVLFIECEAAVIYYMLKSLGQKVKITHCMLYSFVGFFFSLITPSASGGQPAQLYFMKKDRLPLTESTMVLIIVTITYKMVLVVAGVLILVLRPVSIIRHIEPVIGWCYLGVVLNIICVGAMLMLVFHPTLAESIVVFIMHICKKFFKVKNEKKYMDKFHFAMDRYRGAAKYFSSHKFIIWNVFLVTVAQRFLMFTVTYLVCLSFHVAQIGAFSIINIQAMISVAVDMLPFPGGMGITEKLFQEIFSSVCGKNITLPVMIVSRGISYYTQLLISAIMSAAAYIRITGNVSGR